MICSNGPTKFYRPCCVQVLWFAFTEISKMKNFSPNCHQTLIKATFFLVRLRCKWRFAFITEKIKSHWRNGLQYACTQKPKAQIRN